MLLNVLVPFKHEYGSGERLEQRDITTIQAQRGMGEGDCKVYYRGKDSDGNCYSFRKSDNKGAKIPVITDFKSKLIGVSGIRAIYRITSEEIEI